MLGRIYFNAVYGALGGLLGWMLFSLFANSLGAFLSQVLPASIFSNTTPANQLVLAPAWQHLLDGLFVGCGIGYLVVSVDAIRDRSWVRFVRLATYGVLLGSVGGAIGMLLGEQVNHLLVSGIGGGGGVLKFVASVFTRGLGFLFLGAAVGASEGIAARSLGKFSYGTLGGTLGGFLGGSFFGLVYLSLLDQGGEPAFAGATGYVVMGACIGALSALVTGVFQPASVKVLRGWQEGREYPLDKEETSVGRDEYVDIALFRDMKVEKRHVFIRRKGERYALFNNGAPAEHTLVNDVPVAHSVELRDGDRIQLGNVLLRFQARAAVNRPRPGAGARSAAPAAPVNTYRPG